jgi:hypothetical protein
LKRLVVNLPSVLCIQTSRKGLRKVLWFSFLVALLEVVAAVVGAKEKTGMILLSPQSLVGVAVQAEAISSPQQIPME